MSIKPTKTFLRQLEQLISDRSDLRDHSEFLSRLTSFREAALTPISLAPFLLAAPRNSLRALSPMQLQLLMMAIIFRTASTYGAIAQFVADLQICGEPRWAAVINENLRDESGSRDMPSHAEMLYESFRILGCAFRMEYLTPTAVQELLYLYQKLSTSAPDQVLEDNISPGLTVVDRQAIIRYWRLADHRITSYHQAACATLVGRAAPDPHHRFDFLALPALELAIREASSVDEHRHGDLSFIGLFELVVDSSMTGFPQAEREKALAWSRVHNDEASGNQSGWQSSAEQGHATDAAGLAIDILSRASTHGVRSALIQVERLMRLRLEHWNYTCLQMVETEERKVVNGM